LWRTALLHEATFSTLLFFFGGWIERQMPTHKSHVMKVIMVVSVLLRCRLVVYLRPRVKSCMVAAGPQIPAAVVFGLERSRPAVTVHALAEHCVRRMKNGVDAGGEIQMPLVIGNAGREKKEKKEAIGGVELAP
jgi:hypothetical protein